MKTKNSREMLTDIAYVIKLSVKAYSFNKIFHYYLQKF